MTNGVSERLHRQAQHALQQNHWEKADRSLAEALKRSPTDHVALAMAAELRLSQNDVSAAFALYIRAVNAAPQTYAYKKKFLDLARRGLDLQYSDSLANALVACLRTPELASLLENWIGLMLMEPRFQALYGLGQRRSFDPSNKGFFARLTDLRALLNPLFLEGIRSHIVCNPLFEEFITHVRRHLLDELEVDTGRLTPREHVLLASALSQYALFCDFILDVTEEEQTKIGALRRRIETESNGAKDAAAIATLACYQPLNALKNATEVLENFRNSEPLGAVVNAQIADKILLGEMAASIPSVTEVADRTSADVREQYEAFPYPRWKAIATEHLVAEWQQDEYSREAEGSLRGKNPQILIAGCGTGREAVMLGAIFPDAAITAIDLSRQSLAYAELKAKEHGVRNIAFRQGDILKLASLKHEFDYVSSSGVLHHMDQPIEAWKLLCGLVKPGGLMRIGLYSETGRKPMVAAQEAIRKGGYEPSREGMLRFRREAPNLLDRETLSSLAGLRDYYHLNSYRDLLFHVREQSFDVPRIENSLKQLGLSFAGFHVRPAVLASYRRIFPDDPHATNLPYWHRFEQMHPQTFLSMYNFWCRKAAA